MKAGRGAVIAAIVLLAGACYRQVVQTGRTPSSTVIDNPWTHTFLWGIVPAKPIDVTAQCRSGIATVVTEQSFWNGLATVLTLGIWGPRHVTITCATGSALGRGALEVFALDESPEARSDALARAMEASARTAAVVVLRF